MTAVEVTARRRRMDVASGLLFCGRMRVALLVSVALALSAPACEDREERPGVRPDEPDVAPEGYRKPQITQPWPETIPEDVTDQQLEKQVERTRREGLHAHAPLRGPVARPAALAVLTEREGRVVINATGLRRGTYRVRVHEGDSCGGRGFAEAGDVFAPRQEADQPAGDLGRIRVGAGGTTTEGISSDAVRLTGGEDNVVGRALLLVDDRGIPVACGVIDLRPPPTG